MLNTDTGKYMCVATSSQGIINATIDVDVIGKITKSYYFYMLQFRNFISFLIDTSKMLYEI